MHYTEIIFPYSLLTPSKPNLEPITNTPEFHAMASSSTRPSRRAAVAYSGGELGVDGYLEVEFQRSGRISLDIAK